LKSVLDLRSVDVRDELSHWFLSEPGQLVTLFEQRLLGAVLPDLFGYHVVQLGCHQRENLIASSRISHQLRIELGDGHDASVQLRCVEDALPLAGNAIDVLVVSHVLEFAHDPRRVLREAERALIGEGHIVITLFNPWSFFGLHSIFRRWQGRAPWSGYFITATRVKDWLQLLGFDIIALKCAGYRPPLRNQKLNARLEFLERLGAYCWPRFGNIYVVVGKKRVEGVTPLKVSWRQRRRILAGSVAEPSARHSARGAGDGAEEPQ
jgi:SAM-dependent methyltransferase